MGSIREEKDTCKGDNLDLAKLGADLVNLHTLIQILIKRTAIKAEHQNSISQNYLGSLSKCVKNELNHYQYRLLQRTKGGKS